MDETEGQGVVGHGTKLDDVVETLDAAVKPRKKRKESATPKKYNCAITGRERTKKDLVAVGALRPALAERIRNNFPDLDDDALIDLREVNKYRRSYVEDLLREEHGEFTELDRQVVESISNQATIAENVEADFEEDRTLGEKLSDGLASFGGSWHFLISFGGFIFLWMALNIIQGTTNAFDPYPFILLNLVLSTLAAIQAPIIMMSQKRQETKDRVRSLNDYRVNLKAELEIRHLHEKLDHLISRQWQRLAEIQQIQLDLILQKTPKPRRKAKRKKVVVAPPTPNET